MEIIVVFIAALIGGFIIGGGAVWIFTQNKGRISLETQSQIKEAVKASASQAFQDNNASFLSLANERLNTTVEAVRGEFSQRHEQFQSMVKPLTESYQKVNFQVENLSNETSRLAGALTNNQEAGNWGEIQLRRVVELAGMTAYCDFSEQQSLESGIRPDMIVRLPENRSIIIDSKVSTKAYMESQEQNTGIALKRHANALRSQVDDLSRKQYGADEETSLDFVVMFVPGDQFLAAALQEQPGLVEYAMSKRVAITTPASLISLLWTVANGWQQHRIAKDAQEIQLVGEEMFKRLMGFINHYDKVGKGLSNAVKSYNTSINSFDRMVVPQGRKFALLSTGNDEGFDNTSLLEEFPRNSRYLDEEYKAQDQETMGV